MIHNGVFCLKASGERNLKTIENQVSAVLMSVMYFCSPSVKQDTRVLGV